MFFDYLSLNFFKNTILNRLPSKKSDSEKSPEHTDTAVLKTNIGWRRYSIPKKDLDHLSCYVNLHHATIFPSQSNNVFSVYIVVYNTLYIFIFTFLAGEMDPKIPKMYVILIVMWVDFENTITLFPKGLKGVLRSRLSSTQQILSTFIPDKL